MTNIPDLVNSSARFGYSHGGQERRAQAMDGLNGRRIMITGAAGDIGTAIAVRLVANDAHVTLTDVRSPQDASPSLARVAAAATSNADFKYAELDITRRDEVDAFFGSQETPDVVIANAGIVESAPFLEITEQQWDRHLSTNLTGTFHIVQAAARALVAESKPGHVVLMGSWVQAVPWPEIAAYSASKAAIKMLGRTAALELAEHNVRVNVIAPGIVNAGLAAHQLATEPQYAARVKSAIPLGELQTADQVAEVAAFLCSDHANYMTGSVLLADGGCSLGS
jgi:NAD(P)-dependent dehydrogenase (short-subunit alcohol dehydrogenase family)